MSSGEIDASDASGVETFFESVPFVRFPLTSDPAKVW